MTLTFDPKKIFPVSRTRVEREAIWWGQAERWQEVLKRMINVVGKLEIDDYSRQACLVVDDLSWEERV